MMNRLSAAAKCFAISAIVFGCAEKENFTGTATPEALQIAESIRQMNFVDPDEDQIAAAKNDYPHLDPKKILPPKLKAKALAYYKTNLSKIQNKKYLSIVDFSKHSSIARFFVIDMESGEVWPFHVAHGRLSDPNNSGHATRFSNKYGSEESSLGFYRTGEVYDGKHPGSLRLDGLSPTNSNARIRDLVVHEADYVADAEMKPGRSDGCFAVPRHVRKKLVDLIKEGSILFAGREG